MLLPLAFSLLLSTVSSSAIAGLLNRDIPYCPAEAPVVQVYIYKQIVSYPVVINTYISANTIININGGVEININNAPVYLSTTVTATSTSTSTSTSTVSATFTASVTGVATNVVTGVTTAVATATSTATATPFLISIAPAAVQKRQFSSTFIGAGGKTTTDCTNATVWSLISGQLFSNGFKISTNGKTDQPFAASAGYGNISTVFETFGTELEWINPAFVGGSAIFHLLNGTVMISFDGTVETGSIIEILQTVPASACIGGSTSSTSTTSTISSTSSTSTSSTSSSSTSTSASPTPSFFAIQASGAGVDGQYAQVVSLNDTLGDNLITFVPDAKNASQFTLNTNGNLLDIYGDIANQDPTTQNITNGYPLYLNPPDTIAPNNFTLPICTIGANDILSCAETDGRNLMQYCAQYEILFLNFVIQKNCSLVTLTALPPSDLAKLKKRDFVEYLE